MSKRLINTVDLRFFQDDADGSFGLTHKESISMGFNAFYRGIQIFHDVFEHWFEHEHKHFRGDYGFNVGGEMAAMGAAAYFYGQLHVSNRSMSGDYFFYDTLRRENEGTLIDIISNGGSSMFGSSLECNVPYQRPVDDGELEYQIKKMYDEVMSTPIDGYSQEDRKRARAWKKSITLQKIANLHRWGFRMAERMVPNNYQNRNTLYEFIKVWDGFCQRNPAEEMMNCHRGITFRIYKEKGIVTWTAEFVRDQYYEEEYFETPKRLSSSDQWIHKYAA